MGEPLWSDERIEKLFSSGAMKDYDADRAFLYKMRDEYEGALAARLPDSVKETLVLLIEEQARQLSTPENMLWDSVKDALNDLGIAKMWLEGNWPE